MKSSKTKLEEIIDTFDCHSEKILCPKCKKKIADMAKELYDLLKETLGERKFKILRKSGIITNIIAWEVQSIGINEAYNNVIHMEGFGE